MMKEYDYIIPIGFFCSPALELKRFGFRSQALPFDWVICDLETVGKLIESNFHDLFNLNFLKMDKNSNIVSHKTYNFSFFHDFIASKTIEEQVGEVESKYMRRIERLYSILKSNKKILFLRYTNNDSNSDFDCFVMAVSKYTENFDIYTISNMEQNDKTRYYCEKILFQDFVRKDVNDSVSRKFFDNKNVINNFEKHVGFSVEKKEKNLLHMNMLMEYNHKYDFGSLNDNLLDLFYSGWGNAQGNNKGRWTIGQKIVLKLRFENKIKNCNIVFKIIRILTKSKFIIIINGNSIDYSLSNGFLSLAINEDNSLKIIIEIIFNDKVSSPEDLGINTDKRQLGILFEYFKVID